MPHELSSTCRAKRFARSLDHLGVRIDRINFKTRRSECDHFSSGPAPNIECDLHGLAGVTLLWRLRAHGLHGGEQLRPRW